MSTVWHYGIVRHPDGSLSLCEIVRDDERIIEIIKQPMFTAWVAMGESEQTIIRALQNALRDARKRPIVNEQDVIP